ncbi:MAG: hypothetical protein JXP73_05745 [Deltaproteobacteria bacterium]|nr:hypothetical protein [Deltaproteobacteria bacterium]
MRLRAAVTIAVCLAGLPAVLHAEPLRYDWRIEDGVEYDSNPGRIERIEGNPSQPAPPASALARLVVAGSLAADLGERNTLAASGAFGGKWFLADQARAENVLVAQASANHTLRLWRRTQAAAAVSYYDVFQRRSTELPDFRSLLPSLRLEQGLGRAFLASLGAGYRWFSFKPDGAYSFHAPTVFLLFRHVLPGDVLAGAADWEWSAGGNLEARAFDGAACTESGCDPGGSGPRHDDRFWIVHAGFARTGAWLFGAGAAMHINQSNSYGEALVRGLLHARTVVALPWEIALSARAELVATRYRDPLTFLQPVAGLPSASIEDESRSTLRVEISRVFAGHIELGARYVYYTSAPTSSAVDFRRHTALLYVALLDEK